MKENGQIVKKVNPSIIQYNERLSNQNEIETVFGQEFVEKRLQVASIILKMA